MDGGLQVLLVAGLVRAHDDRGQTSVANNLERKQIGKTTFKIEATSISKAQLIQIRKLFQAAGIVVDRTMRRPASATAGEARNPRRHAEQVMHRCALPSRYAFLERMRHSSGNEQLMALYERRDDITCGNCRRGEPTAEQVEARLPIWEALVELLRLCGRPQAADGIRAEAQAICDQRLLLDNPDPVRPLRQQLEDLLRRTLLAQQDAYNQALRAGWDQLEADASWTAISNVQQSNLAQGQQIDQQMDLQIGSFDSLLNTLAEMPLNGWKTASTR